MGERCAKAPCKSCPYRKDVPSGVWAAHEYEKLPAYDGEMVEQLQGGAVGLFDCHQRDGNLCAGWVAAHGAHNLIAFRIAASRGVQIDPSVYTYTSPVPVFASGQEACDHGLRDIEAPAPKAQNVINRLVRKQANDQT